MKTDEVLAVGGNGDAEDDRCGRCTKRGDEAPEGEGGWRVLLEVDGELVEGVVV